MSGANVGAADLVKWPSGSPVPVSLKADGTGNVATRGQGVEVVGVQDGIPQVQLTTARGQGVGILTRTPDAFDSSKAYANDEVVGDTELELVLPVYWVEPTAAYAGTETVGDRVIFASGGQVEAHTGPITSGVTTLTNTLGVDANGNLENDTAGDIEIAARDLFPWGEVIMTAATDFGHGSKIAVAKLR